MLRLLQVDYEQKDVHAVERKKENRAWVPPRFDEYRKGNYHGNVHHLPRPLDCLRPRSTSLGIRQSGQAGEPGVEAPSALVGCKHLARASIFSGLCET